MKQNFTQHHLIRYLYEETTASEGYALREALALDPDLYEEYESLKQAYEQLPRVKFSPSSATLQNVLRYSRRQALQQQA